MSEKFNGKPAVSGKLGLSLALTVLIAGATSYSPTVSASYFNLLPAASAQAAEGLPIRDITVDSSQQLVVVFATGGAFPTDPSIMELNNPRRLVIDFTDASFDSTLPKSEVLSQRIAAAIPGVREVRPSMLTNQRVPKARIVLDLDDKAQIKPMVSKKEEGAITISLVDPAAPVQSASAPAQSASAPAQGKGQSASSNAQSAYEDYYSQFYQQKEASANADKEWGPRKGTLAETGGKLAIKPLTSWTGWFKKPKQEQAAAPAANNQAQAQPAARPAQQAPAATATNEMDTSPDLGQTQTQAATNSGAAGGANNGWDEWSGGNTGSAAQKAAPAVQPVASAPVQQETEPVMQASAPVPQSSAPVPQASAPAATETPMETASEVSGEEAAAQAEVAAAETAKTHNLAVKKTAMARAASSTESESTSQANSEENAEASESAASTAGGDVTQTPKYKARKAFNKAVREHLSGNLPAAIEDYKAAVSLDNELGQAHSNLGLAYNQMHNYASALVSFRKALAVNASDAITYNGIGAALLAQKDLMGATKNFQTSVKLNPRLAVAHYNLGTAYEQQREFDKAMASYQLAIKCDSNMGEVYYRMGLIMQQQKRTEEAKTQYTKALKLSGSSDYADDARKRLASLDKKIK